MNLTTTTASTADTLDDLANAVRALHPRRRDLFLSTLEIASMDEQTDERPKDVKGQLDLYGFRALVETDDHLKTASIDDIAQAYGIGRRSLLRYVANGQLNAVQFGRRYRVTIAELKRFLSDQSKRKRRPTKTTNPTTKKEGGTDADTTTT